jgi:nitronate monooxygenase
MGTAFLGCPESGASAQHKQALKSHAANGTTITRAFSGRPARAIRNAFIEHTERHPGTVLPFPAQHRLTVGLRAESSRQGTPEYAALWAGQGYALATGESVAEVIARCAREAREILP